jgi:CBS domain-containing protein
MALRARDVMQTSVMSVEPNTPLVQVARLFLEEEIHGAPVVDETERLLGVVSVTDLLRAVGEEHESAGSSAVYFRDVLEFSGPDWTSAPQDFQDRLAQVSVGDVMQSGVVTVTEDTTVPEIAKLMRAQRIHRVIVVRGEGRVVGLITALDLIGLLEA